MYIEILSENELRSDKTWHFFENILPLSSTDDWETAKKEWREIARYTVNYGDEHCICGHDISECIVTRNDVTDNKTIIGNCCINKLQDASFLRTDIDRNKFFRALYKGKSNQEVIDQSFSDQIINNWEYNFMTDVWRKRNFTEKQLVWYTEINKKMINHYRRNKQIQEDKK